MTAEQLPVPERRRRGRPRKVKQPLRDVQIQPLQSGESITDHVKSLQEQANFNSPINRLDVQRKKPLGPYARMVNMFRETLTKEQFEEFREFEKEQGRGPLLEKLLETDDSKHQEG